MSAQIIRLFSPPRGAVTGSAAVSRALPVARVQPRSPSSVPAFGAILRKILASTRSAWQLDGAPGVKP